MRSIRLVLVVGGVGLLFACFTAMSAFEGRWRDVAESGAAAVLLLGAAAFLFARVFMPSFREQSRLAQLEATHDRWTTGRARRGTAGRE